MITYKKWLYGILISSFIAFLFIGIFNIIIDPYFHYHKPVKSLQYELKLSNQRYQNDGIVKNFEYDAIITGSSMTENFRTSELNDLFCVNSIKVPYGGGNI